MLPSVCQKSRRIRHSNSPSADCQSKIGDMCDDFRAFPQEKLPYAWERPGAERPVTECNTQKSGSSRKHRERMQERLKEVFTPVPHRREASPRLFRRLSLLLMERLAWATRELCELVHRFEPKRVQQGTQDFVPSTNMCVQLHRHLPLCRKTGQGHSVGACPQWGLRRRRKRRGTLMRPWPSETFVP